MYRKFVIFTDVDGTLIDSERYSWKDASQAVSLIRKRKIPLVLCSSKTKREIEVLRKEIKNKNPFIVENGSAIFIPKNYFDFDFDYSYKKGRYYVIQLGEKYNRIIKALWKIKKLKGIKVSGFKDMSVKDLSKDCGLTIKKARLAKKREFSEPFILKRGNIEDIKKAMNKMGLTYMKGRRYHYIMGDCDKGEATKILIGLFKRKYKNIVSVALGDSFSDLPMLKSTDIAIIVKMQKDKYDSKLLKYGFLKKAKGIGPKGWNSTILDLIK